MRKNKNLVNKNNASILAILLLLWNFLQNFLWNMQFFPTFCSLSLIFVFFPHFLQIFLSFFENILIWSSNFEEVLEFWKQRIKWDNGKIRIFQKNIHPCLVRSVLNYLKNIIWNNSSHFPKWIISEIIIAANFQDNYYLKQ